MRIAWVVLAAVLAGGMGAGGESVELKDVKPLQRKCLDEVYTIKTDLGKEKGKTVILLHPVMVHERNDEKPWPAWATYDVTGYDRFSAKAFLRPILEHEKPNCPKNGCVRFSVWACPVANPKWSTDGRDGWTKVYDSGWVIHGDDPVGAAAMIRGMRGLALVVEPGLDITCDVGVWADARISKASKPKSIDAENLKRHEQIPKMR